MANNVMQNNRKKAKTCGFVKTKYKILVCGDFSIKLGPNNLLIHDTISEMFCF